jgi:nucleotide-binding universal stress UspA family protein
VKDLALAALVVACATLVGLRLLEHLRRRRTPRTQSVKRILFPFVGRALSQPVLDATLRLARAEQATLVPAYLARVPLNLSLTAPLARECMEAMPLLEAIEQRAIARGVAFDSRIERGRTHRHAMRQLLAHEHYDRVAVAADTSGTEGFDAADIAWLLDHAGGEILILRPAHDMRLVAGS